MGLGPRPAYPRPSTGLCFYDRLTFSPEVVANHGKASMGLDSTGADIPHVMFMGEDCMVGHIKLMIFLRAQV